MSAMSRDGGTMVTSEDSACAICARRLSLGVAPYTSLHSGRGSKCAYDCVQQARSSKGAPNFSSLGKHAHNRRLYVHITEQPTLVCLQVRYSLIAEPIRCLDAR